LRDRAYLQRRLSERSALPEQARAIDEALWAELGTELAILVSDMSGFTRIARAHGITHFLALHYQGLALARPLFAQHNGRLLKTEADNLIATFVSPIAAAHCARALQQASADFNASRPGDDRINFCLGLGYGRVLNLSNDAFGDEVNFAYKLGEDLACAGEILATEAFHEALVALTDSFQFEARAVGIAGRVELGYRRMKPCG